MQTRNKVPSLILSFLFSHIKVEYILLLKSAQSALFPYHYPSSGHHHLQPAHYNNSPLTCFPSPSLPFYNQFSILQSGLFQDMTLIMSLLYLYLIHSCLLPHDKVKIFRMHYKVLHYLYLLFNYPVLCLTTLPFLFYIPALLKCFSVFQNFQILSFP